MARKGIRPSAGSPDSATCCGLPKLGVPSSWQHRASTATHSVKLSSAVGLAAWVLVKDSVPELRPEVGEDGEAGEEEAPLGPTTWFGIAARIARSCTAGGHEGVICSRTTSNRKGIGGAGLRMIGKGGGGGGKE